MNSLDSMLERNRDFAARQSAAGTLLPSLPRSLPNVKAVIIGCADMRVDPAHVLGIKLGEAVIMRNIGGRITPGLLEQLGLLGRIGQVAGEISWRRRGVSPHRTSAHRLRHHAPRWRPGTSGALFSNPGTGTQGQIGLGSSHRDCSRRRCAPGGSGTAGRLAHLRPHL
jgi:Carbonic anhydrase